MKVYFILLLLAVTSLASDNGLGSKPQMGWNSWNAYKCNVTDEKIMAAADALVNKGLKELGYTYVNIDDCWNTPDRDENSNMIVNATQFPGGMKILADYVHHNDLKFGIYSSAGVKTCEEKAGSLNYETQDANQWASWGVDYLKYDNCFNVSVGALARYTAMKVALNNTGRPIFYSICNWGLENTASWAPAIGNSWRTTDDIKPTWASVSANFNQNQLANASAGPGGWNDPDMLEVGNEGLTLDEQKTHFALWAFAKAPLIIGTDLKNIDDKYLNILKNKDLINVNQNSNFQAYCVKDCTSTKQRVYMTTMGDAKNVSTAVMVVNWGESQLSNYKFSLKDVGFNGDSATIKDLWTGIVSQSNGADLTISTIPSHGSEIYIFSSGEPGPNTAAKIEWYFYLGGALVVVIGVIVIVAICFNQKKEDDGEYDQQTDGMEEDL